MDSSLRPCPLCNFSDSKLFYHDMSKRNRQGSGVSYYRCLRCKLVFMGSEYFISAEAEKAVYDLHENDPSDAGYRRFLGRIFEPINGRIAPNSFGFDFGSGPGPTLSRMFEEAGHQMAIYDPFYAMNKRPFEQTYDFITATEVVEHLHHPQQEFNQLWACLKPNGLLGIMTKRVLDLEAFTNWHYKNDPTHVCFFAVDTFEWLASQWKAKLEILDQDIVLFSKIKLLGS
ncbi:MAG: class I SAM-dependent methyltransferase [Chloroflexota bacterium]